MHREAITGRAPSFGVERLVLGFLCPKFELFLTMVKSRITRSVSGAGVAAADAEAIVTVGIRRREERRID